MGGNMTVYGWLRPLVRFAERGMFVNKLISIIVAVALVSMCSGCCSVAAADKGAHWAIPLTIPVDIVLFPVEAVGLYMISGLAGVK